jgi:anti-sigma regulatory factor (Ser/Thr protein kinase)
VPDLAFKIRNDFADLPAAAVATAQFLEANNASSEIVYAANLAIEEIVTNTIKYAYRDTLQHEITIRLSLTESALEIEICDDGSEFDPFIQPEPDLRPSCHERKAGGLGIHFVRNMLDACTYVRKEGHNIVRVSKRL